MSPEFGNIKIQPTCPKCGKKINTEINLSKTKQNAVCPHCGANILFDSGRDSLDKQIDAGFKKSLKKSGLK
jgi:DNA-directed RNA polymerase subunit RPC12/RpoP